MWMKVFKMWQGLLFVTVILLCGSKLGEGQMLNLPPNVAIHETSTLRILCNVTGINENQTLSATWTKKGNPDFVIEQPELVIAVVSPADSGVYVCEAVVKDRLGNPQWSDKDQTTVSVQYQPRWKPYTHKKFTGRVGKPSSLFCTVRAWPKVTFHWEDKSTGMRPRSRDQEFYSELPISMVREEHFGEYTCFATNTAGEAKFPVYLLKPGKPDSPFMCNLLNVTGTEARLSCLPGYDGGEKTSFPVYQSLPYEENRQMPTRTDEVEGQVVITVGELRPNTSYTLLVYAENSHGRSEDSFALYVVTTDGVFIPWGEYPPHQSSDLPLIPIIAGAAGGSVFVILLLLLVILCCKKCRRAPKPASTPAPSKEGVRNNSFRASATSVDNDMNFNPSAPTHDSFRQATRWRGSDLGDPAVSVRNSVPDVTSPASHIQLSGVVPGEESSDSYGERPGVGFDNIAYCPETFSETNLDRGVQRRPRYREHPVAVRPDSYHAAQALNKRQSGIAGMGALSGLPYSQQPYEDSPNTEPQPPIMATSTSLQDLNAQPILKPLNITRPAGDGLNDLNQPGPQTVPIRTNLNVRGQPPNPANRADYSLPEELYEFPREKLNLRQRIGDGLYGEVWRARADGIMGRRGQTVVAVKMLKDDYTSEERRAILRELKTMKSLQPHPNVVALMGCCTLTDPLYIIMEYAGKGSLQYVLRSYRLPWSDNPDERYLPYANLPPVKRLTTRDLIGFAYNIASGMEYISSREFLHRDLAVRNILVDEKYICKISDFGSSRDIAQSRQYESRTQNRLPIRWMSPESLYDCIYSIKSDIWSFGVLLWEIVTLGSSPYPGMSGADVMELVKRGYRMDKPQLCSDSLYNMMRDCWRHDPRKRPTFTDLVRTLTGILQLGAEIDLEVTQMTENFYEILENLPGEKC